MACFKAKQIASQVYLMNHIENCLGLESSERTALSALLYTNNYVPCSYPENSIKGEGAGLFKRLFKSL